MTNLTCGVNNCTNNTCGNCTLPTIKVEGPSACAKCETCCSSFQNDNGAALNNSFGGAEANPNMKIGCTVQECTHNATGTCDAAHVDVEGAGAFDCSGTQCQSFAKR